MKKYIKFLAFSAAIALSMTACDDADGEGQFTWEGSENPEHTSYRNPVWEPSLAGGTVFKAASNFVGISQETQWAKGLPYACPSLQSPDIMKWSSNQQAFSYPEVATDAETGATTTIPGSYPEWISGKITHVSADFARTIAGANYWLIYASDDDNAFGAATASSGPGPYNDLGKFLSAEELGVSTLRYPGFSVIAQVNYYLGYTTEDGSYLQGLTLRRGQAPTKKGAAVKVSNADFQDIILFRSNSNVYYLIGTVTTGGKTEIRYGRSNSATGPFLDKSGASIADGASQGELLVTNGTQYGNPCNPMRMFQGENGFFYLAYNATMAGNEVMPSGYARQPLFINPVEIDDDGWFTSVIEPKAGWTTPRYE